MIVVVILVMALPHYLYLGARPVLRDTPINPPEQKGGKVMSKKSKRIAMILVGVVMALLAVAQHFGWITGPSPLLAPGIQ